VNAVADGDLMPLAMAVKLQDVNNEHIFRRETVAGAGGADRVEVLGSDPSASSEKTNAGNEQDEHCRQVQEAVDSLIADLRKRGARENWRRDSKATTKALIAEKIDRARSQVIGSGSAGSDGNGGKGWVYSSVHETPAGGVEVPSSRSGSGSSVST